MAIWGVNWGDHSRFFCEELRQDIPRKNAILNHESVHEVTAVKKDVIVLLDVGDSMGDSLPGDLLVTEGTSKLSVFVALVVELLDTVAYAITFNISGASVVLSLVSIHFDITFIQKSAAMTCQPSRKTLVFILL
uniref:Uncharacterized protein n=1 Tax=Physcomitrium patens TaxID=3218 RepID=A0A2K1K8I3_PHYPA|nr:hypothetical protein PHYPA_011984 [Physcomitrium patens]